LRLGGFWAECQYCLEVFHVQESFAPSRAAVHRLW